MEFPDTGKQCNIVDCKQLDFLPIQCAHCQLIFCKDHSVPDVHSCTKFVDNVVSEKKMLESFKCNFKECKQSDVVEMNCVICKKHFCLEHRHHGCLDAPPSQSKREKMQAPKEQFRKAKAESDKLVESKLKASSNRALVNKIKLMKLKRVAVGDNHIPTNDRVFFAVAPPLEGRDKSESKAVFVSKAWSIGRSLDLMVRRLKISNKSEPGKSHLRLFNVEGEIITFKMDTVVSALMEEGILVDGDSLILEYLSEEDINCKKNSFCSDSIELSKYKWM